MKKSGVIAALLAAGWIGLDARPVIAQSQVAEPGRAVVEQAPERDHDRERRRHRRDRRDHRRPIRDVRPERPDRPERPERPARPERPERPARPERPETVARR